MNLNSIKDIKKLDTGFVAESTAAFADQLEAVFNELDCFNLPADYKNIDKIVLDGMGGSNLGARLVKSLFKGELKSPFLIEPGYALPGYVDSKTLYIICSYSGTTEEPLSTFEAARAKGAKIFILTARTGKDKNNILLELAEKNNLPHYAFDPVANPSLEPRTGVGYMIAGTLALLFKAGTLDLDVTEILNNLKALRNINRQLDINVPVADNEAKQIAKKIHKFMPILCAGDMFEGNLHILRNQINESAKNFAAYLTAPELNHYAMEGLEHPAVNKKALYFVFFDSKLYHPRVAKRLALTKEIVKKNSIKYLEIELDGKTKLAQSFELCQVGLWISYYLGILNGVNPKLVKWVDWFKKELGKE